MLFNYEASVATSELHVRVQGQGLGIRLWLCAPLHFTVGCESLKPLRSKADCCLFSPFFQVIVAEMLEAWGPTGLEGHARSMQESYASRAKALVTAAGEI